MDITESSLKALMDMAGSLIQEFDKEAYLSLTKFVDQLPSVFNQVAFPEFALIFVFAVLL